MNNGIEYLVKYSVAPSPSRDYYGLKILQDEVILYVWRISHGPHKAPIIQRTRLVEFRQEKFMQDEIRHIFGEHILEHVKNITAGNINTLLTLPKFIIKKIARYLKYTDIVKLTSLSHIAYEVFNADSLWQILYERGKNDKINIEEKWEAKVYGWKQLYKDKQMQMSTKEQKNFRMHSSFKHTNHARINKPLMTSINSSSKIVSKTTPAINVVTKKRLKSSNVDLITTTLSRTIPDIRFRDLKVNTEKEKSLSQMVNERNSHPWLKADEQNMKRRDLDAPKTVNRKTRSISNSDEGFNKQPNKSKKRYNKISNVNTISQKDNNAKSVTSKTPCLRKKTLTNVHSSSNLVQNLHDKTRSKIKCEKISVTKSEMINTDKLFSDNSFILEDSNFDLADLIEASLKNIRSPRKIFDYDFSYMPQMNAMKDILKIKNEVQNIDQLKSTRSKVFSNSCFDRMTREDRILEKLSEKSEVSSVTSIESLGKAKKSLLRDDNKLLFEKYIKTQAKELKKPLDWRRSDPISFETGRDLCLHHGNKYLGSNKTDNIDEKFSSAKKTLKTSDFPKICASNNLKSGKSVPVKSSEIMLKNRRDPTKIARDD